MGQFLVRISEGGTVFSTRFSRWDSFSAIFRVPRFRRWDGKLSAFLRVGQSDRQKLFRTSQGGTIGKEENCSAFLRVGLKICDMLFFCFSIHGVKRKIYY